MSEKKYIIQFTLPSGTKLAASGFEGKFALVAISGQKLEGRFLVFSTGKEASKFMKDLRAQNEEQYEKLLKLKPEIVAITALN